MIMESHILDFLTRTQSELFKQVPNMMQTKQWILKEWKISVKSDGCEDIQIVTRLINIAIQQVVGMIRALILLDLLHLDFKHVCIPTCSLHDLLSIQE